MDEGVLRWLVLGVAALTGAWLFKRFFAAPPEDKHHVDAQCTACGWKGRVSRYKPRCSRCGAHVTGP